MAPQWRQDLNAALGASRAALAAGDSAAAVQYASQAQAAARTPAAQRAASEAFNAASAPGLQRLDEERAQLFGQGVQPGAPDGGPPPGQGGPPGMSAYEAELLKRDRDERDAMQRQQRETASSFLRGILEQYGMGSLASQVEGLVNTWGTNVDVIAEKLRGTQEYQTRFKGLVGLQRKGITDVRTEADYLNLETSYRQVFREAGLRNFLGESGTQAEYDAIADLVANYSLSVNEVRARVSDAQRVAAETPQEVRDALQRFYGVDSSDLVAYSLDPSRTMTRINEKANAAILGGYAARAGLDIDVAGAERVAGLAGGEDINVEVVQREMAEARQIRDATRRLAEIEQGTLSDIEVIEAGAKTDVAAGERIRTLQSRERARFGGSTAIGSRSLASARTI